MIWKRLGLIRNPLLFFGAFSASSMFTCGFGVLKLQPPERVIAYSLFGGGILMWFAAMAFYVYAFFCLPRTRVELMFSETLKNQEIPEHTTRSRSARRARAATATAQDPNGESYG